MVTTSTEISHSEILPIEALILDRCKALGLSRVDLVRRAGYRNLAKGRQHSVNTAAMAARESDQHPPR